MLKVWKLLSNFEPIRQGHIFLSSFLPSPFFPLHCTNDVCGRDMCVRMKKKERKRGWKETRHTLHTQCRRLARGECVKKSCFDPQSGCDTPFPLWRDGDFFCALLMMNKKNPVFGKVGTYWLHIPDVWKSAGETETKKKLFPGCVYVMQCENLKYPRYVKSAKFASFSSVSGQLFVRWDWKEKTF